MTEQIGFLFDQPAPQGLISQMDATPSPDGQARNSYPLELAFRLLGMMAGEALCAIEEIVAKADEIGAEEIKRLAETAIRRLTDEPTREFVNASTVRPRAIRMSKDCDYG